MTSYNSQTFEVLVEGSLAPYWSQEASFTRRQIPYSNTMDIQFMGRPTQRVQARCEMATSALSGLMTSVGVEQRTLSSFLGADWQNVMLVGVTEPELVVGPGGLVQGARAMLEFERSE